MAGSNYRLCDVCGRKAFYDANLNYSEGAESMSRKAFRVAGEDQYDSQEKVAKWGVRLDYVGDWAVICTDCAKTHRCVIVPANTR